MDQSLMLQASKFNRIEALRYGLAGPTSTPNPDASTRAGGGGQFVTGGGGQLVTGGGGQLIIGSAASVGGGRPIPGGRTRCYFEPKTLSAITTRAFNQYVIMGVNKTPRLTIKVDKVRPC